MKWRKIKIKTSKNGIEPVENEMYALGLTALEIEDGVEFEETLEMLKSSWNYIDSELAEEKVAAFSVSVYLPDNTSSDETIKLIQERISVLKKSDQAGLYAPLEIISESFDEEDYAENWKKYFKPIPVGEKILINPVWESVPPEYVGRVVFFVDPGMSFGTGSHETTRLCVQAGEKYIKSGDVVLDIGCGSGILSIIAVLLGADFALAADIDQYAVETAIKNAETNNIPSRKYMARCGDILTNPDLTDSGEHKTYNVIFANITADTIIPLLPRLKEWLKSDGAVILSGIIDTREQDIISALEINGYAVHERLYENGWVAVVCGTDIN